MTAEATPSFQLLLTASSAGNPMTKGELNQGARLEQIYSLKYPGDARMFEF